MRAGLRGILHLHFLVEPHAEIDQQAENGHQQRHREGELDGGHAAAIREDAFQASSKSMQRGHLGCSLVGLSYAVDGIVAAGVSIEQSELLSSKDSNALEILAFSAEPSIPPVDLHAALAGRDQPTTSVR